MTIKEITTLRKAGHIDEALKAAEEMFALNADNYTANALFWCLNDLCKKESEHDSILSLYERMKSLYDDHCSDNELISNTIKNLEIRLDPLAEQIKEAIESAKSGNHNAEILQRLQVLFDSGELNANLYQDFGWLIYYTLKNTPLNDTRKRKQLLHNYLKLNLPRPELLHSLILAEAVKVEKNTPLQFRIRDFMSLWGWDNLRAEDWEQFTTGDGKTSSSLVEKLITVYAKELKTDKVPSPDEFEALVDRALARYPNNQYIPFHKATVLKSKGENEQALEYYKKLILKTPSKFYLWQQMSELVDDAELRIALLCKAIYVERNESFIGGCRLDLAKALIGSGFLPNAKYELDKYHDFYISQGWGLKQDYRDLERQIATCTDAEDSQVLFNRYIPLAEEFIYSAIPSILAIKVADKQLDDKNRPGKKFIQWTLRTKDGTLKLKKPSKFGIDPRAKNGAVFDVKLHEGRIVWIKTSNQNPLQQSWIKKIEGIIKLRTDRNGNPYAILDNAYIGQSLLNGITDGQRVMIIALRQDDGRMSAISLKKV